jgi:hypothetical protein
MTPRPEAPRTPSEERTACTEELLDYATAQFPLAPRSDQIRATLRGRTRREDERGDLVHGAAALAEAARHVRTEERLNREAIGRLAVRDAQMRRWVLALACVSGVLGLVAVGQQVPWALGLVWWLMGR